MRTVKHLYITEKMSVAMEYAKALKMTGKKNNGYIEDENNIVTWCVGHLVCMSYPEKYDAALKKWTLDTLPFLPNEYLYEIITSTKKQYEVVKKQLNRKDISTIYYAGDSAVEGLYLQNLVRRLAGYNQSAVEKQVWIASQTEEAILNGIKTAKPYSYYNNLINSGYLRAIEDYAIGINLSRVLTLKYGNLISEYTSGESYVTIAVGRVMSCVLGMVVRRERDVINFKETPYYRIVSRIEVGSDYTEGEWKAVEGTPYYNSALLYKENGFKSKNDASILLKELEKYTTCKVISIERKKEIKTAPLLYNLAELQSDCSKIYKLSPDQTLEILQTLYEKKLTTYPRTDARVLSSEVAKEIHKNLEGLKQSQLFSEVVNSILNNDWHKNIAATKYTNDKAISDHYAIIPTGQSLEQLTTLSEVHNQVYELIARRFLAIFFPAAIFHKVNLCYGVGAERFFTSTRVLVDSGYLQVAKEPGEDTSEQNNSMLNTLAQLKEGQELMIRNYEIKESKTTPPKRYTSGSIILAMENAGQEIEDASLREQLKGSGIGTSATRAEILRKLIKNSYLQLNKKTQVLTPTLLGEMIYEVIDATTAPILNAKLTATWDKGLSYVAEGKVRKEVFQNKIEEYIRTLTDNIKQSNKELEIRKRIENIKMNYSNSQKTKRKGKREYEYTRS